MDFKSKLQKYLIENSRIAFYKLLSDCNPISGKAKIIQPLLTKGHGHIHFGHNVSLGYKSSPYFYSGYIYLEARNSSSSIVFGDNIHINNNCNIICEGNKIVIGSKTLIGCNVEITDSDFHAIDSIDRHVNKSKTSDVLIGENVFIGSNVKILKGVCIGNNSVIANGAVVTKSIPSNVIAGGVPARVIKKLELT